MAWSGTVLHFIYFVQVSWYRRQKKLHETDRQIFQRKSGRNTLHIRNVNPSDFGNFSCRASNLLGKARTYTALSGQLSYPLHCKNVRLKWSFENSRLVTFQSFLDSKIFIARPQPPLWPNIWSKTPLLNTWVGSQYLSMGFIKSQRPIIFYLVFRKS